MSKLRQFVWPQDAGFPERINSLAISVIGLYALVAVLLDFFDVVDLSSERSQQVLVFSAGLLLTAYLGESAWRRESASAQQSALQRIEAFSHPNASHEIPAGQIRPILDEVLADTSSWRFRGGSARFQRGEVLPRLAKITTLDVPVGIQLLDPRDDELCTAYARYRATARVAGAKSVTDGTVEFVRSEILATIYAAGWYASQSRISPTIVLLRSFSPIRLDLGDRGAVVTVADPSAPGLRIPSDSYLYPALIDELDQASHGLPTVEFSTDSNLYPEREEVGPDHVRRALEACTVVEPDGTRHRLVANGSLDLSDPHRIADRVFARYGP